jgi:hypothetical protein
MTIRGAREPYFGQRPSEGSSIALKENGLTQCMSA